MGARPLVSYPLSSAGTIEGSRQHGYSIGGRDHQRGCRCYACQMVRRRAREKQKLREMGWHCG